MLLLLQEVDEDNIVELESADNLRGSVGTVASSSSFRSETDLKASFQLFYQSIKAGNDDDSLDIPANISPGSVISPTTLDKQQGGDRPPPSSHNSTPHQPTSPIVISLNTRSRQSFWVAFI